MRPLWKADRRKSGVFKGKSGRRKPEKSIDQSLFAAHKNVPEASLQIYNQSVSAAVFLLEHAQQETCEAAANSLIFAAP